MGATGRFPHESSRGNKNLLILFHVTSNKILGLPLKTDKSAQSHMYAIF